MPKKCVFAFEGKDSHQKCEWLFWKCRELWLKLDVSPGWDESSHPCISETRTHSPPGFCAVSLDMRKDCSYGH